MRVLLLCHHDAPLHYDGIARWIASWGTLAGILMVEEPRQVLLRRARREIRRVGLSGFLDVMALRMHYRLTWSSKDARWQAARLDDLQRLYAPIAADTQRRAVATPNSDEARKFIGECAPDFVIALCKNLLSERTFAIPPLGTFVLHPGICPEYRNAHGCFWALARRDLANVGLTLLRIDRGIDTGPVFGYFRAPYNENMESHRVIQDRMLLDNLDGIRECFRGIAAGDARPLSTEGRPSGVWGQPRLTSYLQWKRAARRDARLEPIPTLTN